MNKKISKRIIAITMAMATIGIGVIGYNYDNKIISHADEATRQMTISECASEYSAVNYLTRGLDWFESGSSIYNVGGTVNTALNTKPNILFSNNDSEYATDNWKVKVIDETYSEYKTVEDTKFANYVEKYSNEMYASASADANIGTLTSSDYEACLNLAKLSNKSNNVTTFYNTIRSSLITGSIQLDDNGDAKSNLSKDFIKDAFAILDEDSGITYENLIERYGTHYVQNVQMGGRLQLSYSICSNNAEEAQSLKAQVESDLTTKLDLKKKVKEDKGEVEEDGEDVENEDVTDENNESVDDDTKTKANAIVQFLCGRDKTREATYGAVTVVKEVTTVGPMYNGDIDEWYEAVKARPQCIGTAGEGIVITTLVNHMTEENTGRTQEEIDELSRVLNKKYNEHVRKIKEEQARRAAEIDGDEAPTPNNTNTNNVTVEVVSPVVGPVAIREKADFNEDAALDELYQQLHSGYEIGEMRVANKLVKNSLTGCYNYADLGRMKITFKINKNLENLPVGNSGALSHEMTASPSNISYIFGKQHILGIRNGAYYVEVEYNDGTNEILNKEVNAFKGMGQGQTLELCSFGPSTVSKAIDKGGIYKINVVILYNTTAKYTNKSDNCSQDWKSVYSITF